MVILTQRITQHSAYFLVQAILFWYLKVPSGISLVLHVHSVIIIIIMQTHMFLVWFGVRRRWGIPLFAKNAPVVSQPMLSVSRMVWGETLLGQFSVCEECPSGVSASVDCLLFGLRRRWGDLLFSQNAPVVSQPLLIVYRMVWFETPLGRFAVFTKCPVGVSASLDCFCIQHTYSTPMFGYSVYILGALF